MGDNLLKNPRMSEENTLDSDAKLRNPKGTMDFLPDEQYYRNNIKRVLENTFESYGFLPLETPILCYFDLLSSKYAGGSEILKEVYKLSDQGDRKLGLRYDLTIPFTKVVGMNPNLRLPFKRYEIAKVFRDGPVKLGRNREFTQCDVDVVGTSSLSAEAELMNMAVDIFEKLELEVYISYNNRKLLSGLLQALGIPSCDINQVILSLDKIEKIGREGVRNELFNLLLSDETIDDLFSVLDNGLEQFSSFSDPLFLEGLKELKELEALLDAVEITNKTRFNPFLARGLEIYTGTVFEIYLVDSSSLSSSLGGGGRYDNAIGGLLENGNKYPAVGISFGLEPIYVALTLSAKQKRSSPIDILVIPMKTPGESLKICRELRKSGLIISLDTSEKKLKKSLDFASKEGIKYTIVVGSSEIESQCLNLKNMDTGEVTSIPMSELSNIKSFIT